MMNMLESEIWTITKTDEGNAVLLRPFGSDMAVPIFIGQIEAQAILLGFGEIESPRPLTHDLLLQLIRRVGLELNRVEVREIRDNTFFAALCFSGKEFSESKPLVLDARPSDALALAVRAKCPVFLADTILEEAGVPVDSLIDQSAQSVQSAGVDSSNPFGGAERLIAEAEFDIRREALQTELEGAVAAEEYERAAELRDIIFQLDKDHKRGR
jgi:bifunctional DNase/RNase